MIKTRRDISGASMEKQIEKLIHIFASHIFGPSSDAGYHAPSQLEMLAAACNTKREWFQIKQLDADFSASDERQANDRPDDKMINEITYLREPHNDFTFAKWLILQLKEKQLLAVMAEPRLRIANKRKITEDEVADYLAVPKTTYISRREAGLNWLEKELTRLVEYDRLTKKN